MIMLLIKRIGEITIIALFCLNGLCSDSEVPDPLPLFPGEYMHCSPDQRWELDWALAEVLDEIRAEAGFCIGLQLALCMARAIEQNAITIYCCTDWCAYYDGEYIREGSAHNLVVNGIIH
jgi:hypothetical protein